MAAKFICDHALYCLLVLGWPDKPIQVPEPRNRDRRRKHSAYRPQLWFSGFLGTHGGHFRQCCSKLCQQPDGMSKTGFAFGVQILVLSLSGLVTLDKFVNLFKSHLSCL